MNQLVFRPEAECELSREVAYYSKARSGAGVRFVAAVDAALERAASNPLGGAPFFQQTRRILVKGFPFSIVYRHAQGELLVVAIAPHRKHPLYWIAREGE